MYHSDEAFALMLLSLSLSPMGEGSIKPLSAEEVNALALKLDMNRSGRLSLLLGQDVLSLMRLLSIDEESAYRLALLLGRDMLLSRLIEDCAANGTEIITPFDSAYPKQIIEKLGQYLSPVLFVRGNLALFDCNRIGVLGISGVRTSPELKRGIEHLITESALNGFGLITGEEAGVCRLSAGCALENETPLLCALTGGFNDYISDEAHAYALDNGSVLAISTAHPAAKPNPANAIIRNKLIFCLSKAAFVLTSDLRRGEPEAVKKHLCDYMYALKTATPQAAAQLISKGCEAIEDLARFDVSAKAEAWKQPDAQQMSLF